MNNPFDILNAKLDSIEVLIHQALQRNALQPIVEIGGLELAQEVTRLSKARLYTLVSTRQIPHSKRGNKLYFNRVDLLAWVEQGTRVGKEVANG
ncbi:helix-turn-helix domain-containing protein [Hymenobacter sp. YC55]|uniref:helix-turn-helix domain-containing protein n=1 Tax=Hymenobacter sp. YC55 TaxID=3034019 RepID=UPI0023F89D2C|nr:helix-turn-helix domain-containing protein [Hymenobacter sp. YC55]MDF7810924.1 helix-turn-helix domain-containing protein [Hymenobacter sp. YC55]